VDPNPVLRGDFAGNGEIGRGGAAPGKITVTIVHRVNPQYSKEALFFQSTCASMLPQFWFTRTSSCPEHSLRTDTKSEERVVEHIPVEREMNFSNFGLNLRKDLIHDRIPDSSVVARKKSTGDTFFAINP
jgi:hypothetical protein